MNDDLSLAEEIAALRDAHRRLDDKIAQLAASGMTDQLEIARLKREKLRLKDRIQALTDLSTPDIIA